MTDTLRTTLQQSHPGLVDSAAWAELDQCLSRLEQLDQALELTNTLVMITDVAGKIEYVNPPFAEQTGYSQAELLGQTPRLLKTEQTAPHTFANLWQTITAGQVWRGQLVNQTKQGDHYWVKATISPLWNGQDEITHFVAFQKQLAAPPQASQTIYERRTEQLQTAAEVSRATTSMLDIEELVEASVNLIRERFRFYYVGLFLREGEYAVLKAGTGEAGQIQLAAHHRLKLGEGMIGWCVEKGKAKISLDVGTATVFKKNPVLPLTRSEMALPLISRGETIGALTIQSELPQAFSDEDITLLQTMADQLANALQNARLFTTLGQTQQALQARLDEMETLQQFSQQVASTLNIAELAQIFATTVTNQLGLDHVAVSSYQPKVGLTPLLPSQPTHIPNQAEIEALQSHQAQPGPDGYHLTPLRVRGEPIALLTTSPIPAEQSRLWQALLSQLALALDNARRYEASQQSAQRQTKIKEITTKVRATTDIDTILQTTLTELHQTLGGAKLAIRLKE